MMTINNIIDCVIWLVCILQTRDRLLNMSSKNENDLINQLFFVKETSFQRFQDFIMSSTWETKKLFQNAKKNVWLWIENMPKETLFSEPLPKIQNNFVHVEDVHPPPCMPIRLKVSSYIWGKQCKFLFTRTWHFKK